MNSLLTNSSYQVYGRNPNLPSVMMENPPVHEGWTVSLAFAQNNNVLHSPCQAYTQAESSDNIRKALQHKIWISSTDYHYCCRVCSKQDDSDK